MLVVAAVVEVFCVVPNAARTAGNISAPPPTAKSAAAKTADSKALGPISQTLHGYQLTPAQLISVRNYIGQYDENTKVISIGPVNGVDLFAIKNKKTGEYIGEVELRGGSSGQIVVSKVTAAQFDPTHKVEIPIIGNINGEEASQLLAGSGESNVLSNEKKKQEARNGAACDHS